MYNTQITAEAADRIIKSVEEMFISAHAFSSESKYLLHTVDQMTELLTSILGWDKEYAIANIKLFLKEEGYDYLWQRLLTRTEQGVSHD